MLAFSSLTGIFFCVARALSFFPFFGPALPAVSDGDDDEDDDPYQPLDRFDDDYFFNRQASPIHSSLFSEQKGARACCCGIS